MFMLLTLALPNLMEAHVFVTIRKFSDAVSGRTSLKFSDACASQVLVLIPSPIPSDFGHCKEQSSTLLKGVINRQWMFGLATRPGSSASAVSRLMIGLSDWWLAVGVV